MSVDQGGGRHFSSNCVGGGRINSGASAAFLMRLKRQSAATSLIVAALVSMSAVLAGRERAEMIALVTSAALITAEAVYRIGRRRATLLW